MAKKVQRRNSARRRHPRRASASTTVARTTPPPAGTDSPSIGVTVDEHVRAYLVARAGGDQDTERAVSRWFFAHPDDVTEFVARLCGYASAAVVEAFGSKATRFTDHLHRQRLDPDHLTQHNLHPDAVEGHRLGAEVVLHVLRENHTARDELLARLGQSCSLGWGAAAGLADIIIGCTDIADKARIRLLEHRNDTTDLTPGPDSEAGGDSSDATGDAQLTISDMLCCGIQMRGVASDALEYLRYRDVDAQRSVEAILTPLCDHPERLMEFVAAVMTIARSAFVEAYGPDAAQESKILAEHHHPTDPDADPNSGFEIGYHAAGILLRDEFNGDHPGREFTRLRMRTDPAMGAGVVTGLAEIALGTIRAKMGSATGWLYSGSLCNNLQNLATRQ